MNTDKTRIAYRCSSAFIGGPIFFGAMEVSGEKTGDRVVRRIRALARVAHSGSGSRGATGFAKAPHHTASELGQRRGRGRSQTIRDGAGDGAGGARVGVQVAWYAPARIE